MPRDVLVPQKIEMPDGDLHFMQLREAAEIPDIEGVEWAPVAPYWSILWRSGVALARELEGLPLRGKRVVELGCGLGIPSIVAARGGAEVLATDVCSEALALLARNARENGVRLETARVDWADPAVLLERAPFDLVIASDIVYERASVGVLLSLMPRLAPEAWLAEPGRAPAAALMEQATRRWQVETRVRGVVQIHRLHVNR